MRREARERYNAYDRLSSNTLAEFRRPSRLDTGYLVETYKQWIGRDLPHMSDGMRMDSNPAAGVDGYAMVKKAIALRGAAFHGDDTQMEFAAALITLSGPRDEHAQKAIAGANGDSLLAQNLATHFLGPNDADSVGNAGSEFIVKVIVVMAQPSPRGIPGARSVSDKRLPGARLLLPDCRLLVQNHAISCKTLLLRI